MKVSIPDRVLGFFRLDVLPDLSVLHVSIPDRVLGFFRPRIKQKRNWSNSKVSIPDRVLGFFRLERGYVYWSLKGSFNP